MLLEPFTRGKLVTFVARVNVDDLNVSIHTLTGRLPPHSGLSRARSLAAAERNWLPEAKGYVAQKEAHTVDCRDAESLRVR